MPEVLFVKRANNPTTTLGQLYGYLRDRDNVPYSEQIDFGNEFETGRFDPRTNTVSLNTSANPERNNPYDSYSHEYTHAVLSDIAARLDDSKRLKDTYNKIVGIIKPVESKLKFKQGDLSDEDYKYRTEANERLAYGIGNFARNYDSSFKQAFKQDTRNPHYDATSATELAILLEEAKRTKNKKSLLQTLKDLF